MTSWLCRLLFCNRWIDRRNVDTANHICIDCKCNVERTKGKWRRTKIE